MVGYRVQQLDTFSSSNKCSCCSLLLRDPVQLIACAHRICQSCAVDQLGDMITCPECHQTTPRDKLKLDRGCKNDMQTLSVTCALCEWHGVLKTFQKHLDEIHPNPICSFCGQAFSSVHNLDRHILLDCQQIKAPCPLQLFGCDEEILRVDLSKHYLTERHQRVLIEFLLQRNSSLSSFRNNHLSSTHPFTVAVNNDEIDQITESLDILSAAVQALNDDDQRLTNECVEHQNFQQKIIQDLPIVHKSIEEQAVVIDTVATNQKTCHEDILSMQETLNSHNLSPRDGTMIWKITNVKEKMEAARNNTQSSIYSAPFYSSPTGYKMCLRLYLDGDGSTRHTHLSVFIVLMRGEYDAILTFPFCFNVIFCLLDQKDKPEHIFEVFQPDVRSNSFARPRSDMNIASGLPKFVPLSLLQQENNSYIRDDTMFIKAMVDFTNLPNAIVLKMLNFNPALTTVTQQVIIQQEVEKHQEQNLFPAITSDE